MAIELIVLAADKTMRFTLEALLARPQSLGVRAIKAIVQHHPRNDPGILGEGHAFIRELHVAASHALIVFDRVGCGSDLSRERLEEEVKTRLVQSGWDEDACAAIVIDPLLEAWFWSDSPHVLNALRWTRGRAELVEWLTREGFLHPGLQKPEQPKEAVEKLLRLSRTPYSSSIFRELAEQVSFQRCNDPAFLKLKQVLRQWFPPEVSSEEA